MLNKDNIEFSENALIDFELIDLAVQGDDLAYTKLMNKYKTAVYHMALKMVDNESDAEDLTIESFSKAFKNLKKFKKDYGFSSWLFRITTNNCIDFIRKKKLDTLSLQTPYANSTGETMSIDLPDDRLTPQELAIKTEKIELIRQFLNQLSPKYKTVLELRYFSELSYEEIAAQTATPIGTVKAQLHRAKSCLYNIIKENKEHL